MSKSKSKSKSKQATFPNEYWRPDFEIYTYYPALFDHGKELLAAGIEKPPQEGDAIADEIKELIKKQNDSDERERRRHEIEWEIDRLSHSYQTTLLVGPNAYQKTWHLMNAMSELALVPVMHFKKKFARARPSQLEPSIEPLIDIPPHPAYPSGHSTQNFLVAHVLSEVIGDDAELIARVFAIARRVAENREWAGVHYHSDTDAGEELAREIFPTMKRALADPIREAIEEWQELEMEERQLREELPAAAYAALQEAPRKWDDPFSSSHFAQHQWNLENMGQADARRGVDINVRGAWQQLGVWQGTPAPGRPVRVTLIDLAVDFDHPALARSFDYDAARNLDYPHVPKSLGDGNAAKLRELGWTKEEDVKKSYVDAFGSFSSAHALACAGIIAADQAQVDREVRTANGSTEKITEPGCLGIAPHCRIVPYRAMTLTEPVRHKRETLARAVLEAATGIAFDQLPKRGNAPPAPGWTVGRRGQPSHILFLPLPLEPLPEGDDDPLALALAFAATKIPVIIPSGNKGTSRLSYPSEPGRHFKDPDGIGKLSQLFDLDRNAVRAVFGEEKEEQEKQEKQEERSDEQILKELIFALRNEAAVICVGSCNDQGRRARYSQYGDGLTLVAPSDDSLPSPDEVENGARRPQSIATADLKGIGGYMQDRSHYTLSDNEFGFGGTSAAAAQVTGVVSLMLQANPRLRPTDVHQILCETARIKDAQENDLLVAQDGTMPSKPSAEFGHGLVDASRAVEEAQRRSSPSTAS